MDGQVGHLLPINILFIKLEVKNEFDNSAFLDVDIKVEFFRSKELLLGAFSNELTAHIIEMNNQFVSIDAYFDIFLVKFNCLKSQF